MKEQPTRILRIPLDWHLKSLEKDGIYGINLEKAYKILAPHTPKKEIIVAIIDSGIDEEHEALASRLWQNPREIPANGIDDDRNGYVDDIHGWNYLKDNPDGSIIKMGKEINRRYHELNQKRGKNMKLSAKEQSELEYLSEQSPLAKLERQQKSSGDKMNILNQADNFMKNWLVKLWGEKYLVGKKMELMIQHSHLKTYIDTRLDSLSTTEREFLHNLQMLMTGTVKWEMIMAAFIKENQDLAVRLQELRSTSQVNERKNIGDNMENLNDFGYGTPRLKNKYDFHGTHVSGIIAADNKYSDGAVGIAPDAKIMGIKAIPAGDEYDKDVALAIRYAVDNGAHIINMSFGKSHSSHAKWVSKALKYAARHNVLVVVAAGNDGLCCNDHLSYPSPYCHHGKLHKNMLMIGNSTVSGHPAGDSNYGNKYVDFFAPGTLIYSCYPGNLYKKLSGTSMAAPVVSGVAALILSYFPGIKVEELKNILVESAIIPFVSQKQYRFRENRMVLSPEDLCRAGAILDASVAVEKAIQLSKK